MSDLRRNDDKFRHQIDFNDGDMDILYGYIEDEEAWAHAQSSHGEEELPSRFQMLRQRSLEFTESVTTHGLARVSGSRQILRRLMWLVAFLACFIYGLLQCICVYQEYTQYPKAVSIEMKMERKVNFPAITLCNLNPIDNEDMVRNHDVYGAFVQVQEENTETMCTGLFNAASDPLLNQSCTSPWDDCTSQPSNVFSKGYSDESEAEKSSSKSSPSASKSSSSTPKSNPEGADSGTAEASGETRDEASPSASSSEENSEEGNQMDEHNRTKRDATSGYGNMTMPKWKQRTRSRCSLVFQYQVHIASSSSSPTLESFGVSLGDMSLCSDGSWDVSEFETFYYPPCSADIFVDNLGMYLNVTTEFSMEVFSNGTTKSSCREGLFNSSRVYREGGMKESAASIKRYISDSLTNDISDIRGHFSPSFEVLKNVSRENYEFIELCSIDATHCSYKDFYRYMTNDLGVCYTFNSPHLVNDKTKNLTLEERRAKFVSRYTYTTGPLTGLRLTLNLHKSQQVSMLSPDVGVRVVLHEPWVAPFPESQGFNLAPGMSHSVAISRTVINRIGSPHGECMYDNTGKFDYSEAQCIHSCREREYMKRCGCYMQEGDSLNVLLAEPEFENLNLTRCDIVNVIGSLCVAAVDELLKNDSYECGCQASCREVRYDARVSATNENLEFLQVLQNVKGVAMGADLCGDYDSAVRVHFFLKSNDYEEITESPAYTLNTLISNVGGNMGLFLGMSLLSLLEVADYLVDVLLILLVPGWYHRKNKGSPGDRVTPLQNARKRVVIFAGPRDRDTSMTKSLHSKEKREERFRQIFMSD